MVTEEILRSIDELDASQLRVEKHAFDVINASDSSLNVLREGMANIEEIVNNVNALNSLIEASAANIRELEELSNQIQQFAGAVGKIAGKTNILSLNASIEAARAGEAGRGFAVVAKEVGGLAAQSTKSSKDISDTVDKVKAFVDATIATMQQLYQQSLLQSEKAAQVQETLNTVLSAAYGANEVSRGMEQEIAFQRDVIENVRVAMNNSMSNSWE